MLGSLNLGKWENGVNKEFLNSDGLLPGFLFQRLEDKINEIINTLNVYSPDSFKTFDLLAGETDIDIDERQDLNYYPFGCFLDTDGNLQPFVITNRELNKFSIQVPVAGVFLYLIVQKSN